MFGIVALLSWLWVGGIDNMSKNHPDYKGEDFLNENNKDYEDWTGNEDYW